jgi:hypothetical protein
MIVQPSTNGSNGGSNHDARGHFAKGNRGGPGNPFAARVGKLRSALLSAIKPSDLQAIVAKLVEQAKSGDVAAAKLILDRAVGKVPSSIELVGWGRAHGDDSATPPDPVTVEAMREQIAADPRYLDYVLGIEEGRG